MNDSQFFIHRPVNFLKTVDKQISSFSGAAISFVPVSFREKIFRKSFFEKEGFFVQMRNLSRKVVDKCPNYPPFLHSENPLR